MSKNYETTLTAGSSAESDRRNIANNELSAAAFRGINVFRIPNSPMREQAEALKHFGVSSKSKTASPERISTINPYDDFKKADSPNNID